MSYYNIIIAWVAHSFDRTTWLWSHALSKLYNSHTMHYQHTLNGIVQVADAAEAAAAQLAMKGLLTVMIGHTTSWDAPCQKH